MILDDTQALFNVLSKETTVRNLVSFFEFMFILTCSVSVERFERGFCFQMR